MNKTQKRQVRWANWLWVAAFAVWYGLMAFFMSGCVYRGAKVVEGTDLAVGLDVPGTDGALQLDLLNWLSGFRLAVADNARLSMEYSCAETNSYFGAITTRSAKRVKATVEPCERSE